MYYWYWLTSKTSPMLCLSKRSQRDSVSMPSEKESGVSAMIQLYPPSLCMQSGKINDVIIKAEQHIFAADIQGTCATSGDGLYNSLDWLQSALTQKEVKKAIVKPVQELTEMDTAKKSSQSLSSWLTSFTKYFVHAH